jgi:hypothetical protein
MLGVNLFAEWDQVAPEFLPVLVVIEEVVEWTPCYTSLTQE